MDKYNLIIPCCGEGRRFMQAGYDLYKPALPFRGKPMLHHVIDAFPKETQVWIITDAIHIEILRELLSPYEDIHFISITAHKNGPAWSIAEAAGQLPQHEACFIAYNDVWWRWNFEDLEDFIEQNTPDGIVFTHKGFHPHLYRDNFSAFCKTAGHKLIAIKEKASFTNDWMNEAVSTGVYYVADSSLLFDLLQQMINNDSRVAGEFYPSIIFNDILAHAKSVFTFETRAFVHLGTPGQYEDALRWDNIRRQQNQPHSYPTLIMMCGTGSRMKSIATVNKAGIAVGKTEMFRFVASRMASDNTIFLVNRHTLPLLKQRDSHIDIGEQTETQTESLKKALPHLDTTQGLLVCSNDCYGFFDTELLGQCTAFDMVVFGFKPGLMHRKQQNAHSGFSVSGNCVRAIHYKDCLNADYGFAGMYLFPDLKVLQVLNTIDCHEMGSVDNMADYLLKKNYRLGYIVLTDYVHLGTPEEFGEFLFWQNVQYE